MTNYSQVLFIFMELINLSGVVAITCKKISICGIRAYHVNNIIFPYRNKSFFLRIFENSKQRHFNHK